LLFLVLFTFGKVLFFVFQLAYEGINQHYTQGYLDQAKYLSDTKNGQDIVRLVKDNLANYFEQKKKAAEVIFYL
jgi:hypothetical protein